MDSDNRARQMREAIAEFDHATRPVVRQILDLAQKGVAQANAALQIAESNVDRIADAAVRLATAQADLQTSKGKPEPPSSPK